MGVIGVELWSCPHGGHRARPHHLPSSAGPRGQQRALTSAYLQRSNWPRLGPSGTYSGKIGHTWVLQVLTAVKLATLGSFRYLLRSNWPRLGPSGTYSGKIGHAWVLQVLTAVKLATLGSFSGTRKVSPSPKRYKYEKDAEDVYNNFEEESDQVWSSPSPVKDGSGGISKLRDYNSKSSLLHRKHRLVMAPLTPSECRKQLNGNPRSGNTTPGKSRLQNSSGKMKYRKSSPKACNGAKQSLDFYFSNPGSKNEGTNQNSDSPEFSEFGDEGNDKENIGTPCRKQRAVIAKIIDSLEDEEEGDQLSEQSGCQDKLQNNGSDDAFDQLLKTSNSSFGEISSKKHGSDFRPWLSSSPSGKEEPAVHRVQEPHEIGFPNPAGSNKCWMNATLQALLGLEPFIKELQCNFQQAGSSYSKKSNSAKVLSAFLDVVKSRQRGRQLAINTSLGTLSRSLGLLDAIFVSDCQQDAPEFLVRLLDCFREEFNRVRVSEKKLQDVDNFSLEDLQRDEENKDDPTEVHNPIKENFEFQLHETYSCIQ
uniref:(California timema) hypothetical protein n=1 Tax=Timema californicum TaxID=61474 RepID=A0A7R9JHW8_TIMCA|nr:unnamed protein product [Timema californicum]